MEVGCSLLFSREFLSNFGEMQSFPYLINRMPSNVLGFNIPISLLQNAFIINLPPRVFGCTCFVHNLDKTRGKLDPKANCIFVLYSNTKKACRCYHATSRRLFMSTDVTFTDLKIFPEFELISSGIYP